MAVLKPRARILVVDDQPANLMALRAILEPLGHVLICVESGNAALIEVLRADFALILLDARMPGMDGYETAGLIRQRERSAHTPIIFLTAEADDREAILKAYDRGAVDFLAKPFEPRILCAKVAIFVALFLQGEEIKQHAEAQAHIARLEEARVAAEIHAAALARVSAELARSNRELEQVAYGASHDLKTPLRGIATVCDWLEDDLGDALSGEVRGHLDQLRSRVGRMGAIVDGILAFARVGHARAQPETVDLGALVRDVVELMHPPEGAVVEVAEMPVGRVRRQALAQVFANLIGNALKYARRADARVLVSVAEAGDFYEFAVADNGPGIAPQHHERIWSLFQRLESQDDIEGTGVGLALVKKIIEGEGGRVWVDSDLGRGATFRFLWPISREALATVEVSVNP